MKETKKTFQRVYARRLESEGEKRTHQRFQKIVSFFGKTANLILLLAASVAISLVWQQRIANPYLSSLRAVGGDYFNALTYAVFFARHHPFPPTGWMPFWFGGIPVIGGYPNLFFYLILPITRFFDVPTSMELTSIVFILLYLIAAHFLFWETTRNHLIALLFTGIVLVTPASYYALTGEGLVVASAMQWLLPLTFFFLIRFVKFQDGTMLLAAAVSTGIALIMHPGVSALIVLVPATIYLMIADSGDPKDAAHTRQLSLLKLSVWEKLKTKLTHLTLYTGFALSSGAIGVYTLLVQTFLSGGPGSCDSPQCWGDYPPHLIWFSPLALLPTIFLPASLVAWRMQKSRLKEIMAPLAALTPLLLYVGLAYLRRIDSLSSALFPRRLFWAITLLTLMSMGIAFRYTFKASAKLAIAVLSIFLITLSLSIPFLPKAVHFSLQDYLKIPNSLPMGVESYIVPKYQTMPISEIIPPWLPINDVNWRMDSIRPDFFAWWNTIASLPLTRGYSNVPTKEHLDWLYYLQSSTLIPNNPDELSLETRYNRALFLLDAYGVRFLQHPGGSIVYEGIAYDPLLLKNRDLVKKFERVREWSFVELSEKLITPVVSPTNAARVMVISDQGGYETILRAISLENLNSTVLIPIQGPQSIDKISPKLVEEADAIILYQFTGSSFRTLEAFVENGGKVFIDIGSLQNLPTSVPKLFGAKSLQVFDQERIWKVKILSPSPLMKEIDTTKFSPLLFNEHAWRIVAPPSKQFLKGEMETILTQNDIPVLATGKFGKGSVIFSGFNLPYHIVNYQNEEEAKLLKNIILSLVPESLAIGEFSVNWTDPTLIVASATDAKGIYFKQNYHPGWKAAVNGKKTQVLKAGLGFMYIPFPKESQTKTTTLDLEFRGSLATWGIPALSLGSMIAAAILALSQSPIRLLGLLYSKLFLKRLKSWWAKD